MQKKTLEQSRRLLRLLFQPPVTYNHRSTRSFATAAAAIMPSRRHRPRSGPKANEYQHDTPKSSESRASPPKNPRLTHFLCLPLINSTSRPVLSASLSRFKAGAADVAAALVEQATSAGDEAKQANAEALLVVLKEDSRAVRLVGTLHLTLGVMSLRGEGGDDADGRKTLTEATQLLQDLDLAALMSRSTNAAVEPLTINLRGLSSMHSATKTSFLYTAPSDVSSRLMPFCQRLRDAFVEGGLVIDEKRKGGLKLHVTVLNTIYAKRATRSGKGGGKERHDRGTDIVAGRGHEEEPEQAESIDAAGADAPNESSLTKHKSKRRNKGPIRFDATALLEHFKDFEWASDLQLDRIAICKMGADKIKDDNGIIIDEAYEEIATRLLPRQT